MRAQLITLSMILLSSAAGATSATVCTPNPLLGARAISFSVLFGEPMPSSDKTRALYRDPPGSQALLVDELTAAVERKITEAGYVFETDEGLWSTKDLETYRGTGVPHHDFAVSILGQTLDTPNCNCVPSAFLVHVTLYAEFLTPEYESVETYSFERLGMATSAELDSTIVAVVSEAVDDILNPSAQCPPLEKTTVHLENSDYSLVLTPPGYGELLRYLRREFYGKPVIAELYAEPRSASAQPLARFPLVRGMAPKRILRDDAGHLVALHAWPSSGFRYLPLVVLYRPDGSSLRSLSLEDLVGDQWIHLQETPAPDRWPFLDHFIDEERNALVLSIPSCLFFEPDCRDRHSQLEIDLDTGQKVHPDQSPVPRWGGRFELVLSVESEQVPRQRSDVVCRPGWDESSFAGAADVPAGELFPDHPLPMPGYTEIATKARVYGTIRLEILVSESGEVLCAGVRKGLPMGLSESAVKTALEWKLRPHPSPSGRWRSEVELRAEFAILR